MFRRRKRKNNSVNESQLSPPAAPSLITDVHQKTKASPLMTEAFRQAIEKAVDWPRKDVASDGKIKPMVFFAHGDGTMKAVSFSLKDEYHKESLIRKIREKAHAEHAFAVLLLMETNSENHTAILSGVSAGMKASVYVDYSFDPESKTITSRTINWLNRAFHDTLIDGIFDANV